MKRNQMTDIKDHLLSGKTITSLEAINLYGCTRLSDKIHKMRKAGYIIQSIQREGITRYGRPCSYTEYKLLGFEKGANLNDI